MHLPTVPVIFPLPHLPAPQTIDEASVQRAQYWVKERAHMSAFGGRREVDGQGMPHRQHAAVDLYAPAGTIVMAIADGIIVDDLRGGYLDWADSTPGNHDGRVSLAALAIAHPGVGIIRYCEISTKRAIGVGWRMPVRRGQVIGFVGNQGAEGHGRYLARRQTMLHLEWYWDFKDDKVDPARAHDNADVAGDHVLSEGQRTAFKGGKNVSIAANTRFDCFSEGSLFQRRHDILDPTDLMQSAEVVGMPSVWDSSKLQLAPQVSFRRMLMHASRMAAIQQPRCEGERDGWWRK